MHLEIAEQLHLQMQREKDRTTMKSFTKYCILKLLNRLYYKWIIYSFVLVFLALLNFIVIILFWIRKQTSQQKKTGHQM